MEFILSRATTVEAQWAGAPVQRAVARFRRDLEMTLCPTGMTPGNRMMICLAPALPAESYTLDVSGDLLTLCAADDLGAVYGLLDLSRDALGVNPFWFWNEQRFEPKPFAAVTGQRSASPAAAVTLRGWDLSHAPLLDAWANESNQGWEMAFEALLRCRGNVVRTDRCADLAAAMGLRLMQDPRRPLGAAPQPAAVQDIPARRAVWEDAIRRQKALPRVWSLGCLDAGRHPDAESYSAAVREQSTLVRASLPGAPLTLFLEGSAAAMYHEGRLDLPADVVPVLTPRPTDSEAGGPGPGIRHGLWVELCSRDPMTGNPVTPLPDGDDPLCETLKGAWRSGVRTLWMVDVGDLRPYLETLDLVSALWCRPDTDTDARRTAYLRSTFRAPDNWALTDTSLDDLSVCMRAWAQSTVRCGYPPRAMGENFLSRAVRALAGAWLCGRVDEPVPALVPVLGQHPFAQQLSAFRAACEEALTSFETLLPGCSYAGRATTRLWKDAYVIYVKYYLYALRGAVRFCRAREQYLGRDYRACFATLGQGADDFAAAAALMQGGSGLWTGFYASAVPDCARTVPVMVSLMALPRAAGDGPDYTGWQGALPGAGDAPMVDFALYRAMLRAREEGGEPQSMQ